MKDASKKIQYLKEFFTGLANDTRKETERKIKSEKKEELKKETTKEEQKDQGINKS